MKDLVLHSLVWTKNTILEVELASNLECFSEEKNYKNQILLTISSTYTLSWYTRTLLNTISLATRRSHCCVALDLFQISRLERLHLLDSTWTIKPLVSYTSDSCLKVLLIVFILIWETRAVKKYGLNLSVSLVLFWCLKKLPTFFSNLTDVSRRLLHGRGRSHSMKVMVDIADGNSVHLHMVLRETQFHFLVFTLSQLQNAQVLTCWNLLHLKLQGFLMVEKLSRQLQRV